MILADVCPRNYAYCAVAHGTRAPLDAGEPVRLAEAVRRMALKHVVITSVDRDDLPHGGAEIFAAGLGEIPPPAPGTRGEVLIPDVKGRGPARRPVVDPKPATMNNTPETI